MGMLILVGMAGRGWLKGSTQDTAHLLGKPHESAVSPLPWLSDYRENLWGKEQFSCCNYTNPLNSVTLHKVTVDK